MDYAKLIGADNMHTSVLRHPSDTIYYMPNADANGPDSFSFAVSDCLGNDFRVSDPQEVKIEIDPVPDAPRFFAEFAAENYVVRMYGKDGGLSCATIHGL